MIQTLILPQLMGVAQLHTQSPTASPSPSEVFNPHSTELAPGSPEESLGDREVGGGG